MQIPGLLGPRALRAPLLLRAERDWSVSLPAERKPARRRSTPTAQRADAKASTSISPNIGGVLAVVPRTNHWTFASINSEKISEIRRYNCGLQTIFCLIVQITATITFS